MTCQQVLPTLPLLAAKSDALEFGGLGLLSQSEGVDHISYVTDVTDRSVDLMTWDWIGVHDIGVHSI